MAFIFAFLSSFESMIIQGHSFVLVRLNILLMYLVNKSHFLIVSSSFLLNFQYLKGFDFLDSNLSFCVSFETENHNLTSLTPESKTFCSKSFTLFIKFL